MVSESEARQSLGVLLRNHRLQQGLSQEALAALVEPQLSVDTISKNELTRPYSHTLEGICIALQLEERERGVLRAARRAQGIDLPRQQTPRATMDWSMRGGEAPDRRLVRGQSFDRPHHNLPADVSSFVGREREIIELAGLLGTHRLVTLAGPGGVRKTRLALRLAGDLSNDYADGVFLVELAALVDSDDVPEIVATALDIHAVGLDSLESELKERLGRKRLLLVLDNCERVAGACADLVNRRER